MKKEEKIFVIGKKPTKLMVIINAIILFIISLLLSNVVSLILSNILINQLNSDKYIIVFIVIIFIIFIILLLLYMPAIVSSRRYWNISEKYLENYAINDYFQQLKYVLSIFNGKDDIFAFKIQLTEIKSIRLYWTTKYGRYSTISHQIYFAIALKDGSIINFESLTTTSNKEYVDAVKYLKEKYNIGIDDNYNLLTALEDPSIHLVEYIDKIEKQSNKSGV